MLFRWFKKRGYQTPGFRVADVFTAGGVPSVTYVDRESLGLERKVSSALERRHSFIVVSGPTKCGKSVLCKRVLRGQQVVTIQGGLVTSADEFWNLISYQMRLPTSATATRTSGWSGTKLYEFGATIWSVITAKGSTTVSKTEERAVATNYTNVLSLASIAELRSKDMTLLIDDFHYIATDTQRAIIRALKSAVSEGLRVVILAVPHRAFDAADVENEVEGRMEHVAIPNWSLDDLNEIPEKGFAALRLGVSKVVQRRICEDGFGNPLLVQEICYQLSEARRGIPNDSADVERFELGAIYNEVAARKGLNRFEQLALAPLPPEVPFINLHNNIQIDLNNAVLGAIARLGPTWSTSLDDILGALRTLTKGALVERDHVISALSAMTKMVAKGNSAPFEWEPNRETLNISDPFLMFYIRWALRDRRTITLPFSAIDVATMLQPGLMPPNEEDK